MFQLLSCWRWRGSQTNLIFNWTFHSRTHKYRQHINRKQHYLHQVLWWIISFHPSAASLAFNWLWFLPLILKPVERITWHSLCTVLYIATSCSQAHCGPVSSLCHTRPRSCSWTPFALLWTARYSGRSALSETWIVAGLILNIYWPDFCLLFSHFDIANLHEYKKILLKYSFHVNSSMHTFQYFDFFRKLREYIAIELCWR